MNGTKPYVKVIMRFNEVITQQNAIPFVDRISKIMKEHASRLMFGNTVVLSVADFRIPKITFRPENANPLVQDVFMT
ncbi:hypothetical protein DPMN_190693 [Dreissena polymorpha]|uniref:Uncharacterized protein n=1 Tax=Dreissena polymorpha TaxID=45954 RepID=A0A9D4BC21_DREPO|nr:hypothetical protein DPMN_190693 [Dreissena polymorpha]